MSIQHPRQEEIDELRKLVNVGSLLSTACTYHLTIPGSPALTPSNFQIIALHILDPEESRTGVRLMAITMHGVRLYFSPSTLAYGFSYAQSPSATGSGRPLQLIHVWLPPPNLLHPDEQSSPHRPPTHSNSMRSSQGAVDTRL
jgi:nuclear pore complex protein Nup155